MKKNILKKELFFFPQNSLYLSYGPWCYKLLNDKTYKNVPTIQVST